LRIASRTWALSWSRWHVYIISGGISDLHAGMYIYNYRMSISFLYIYMYYIILLHVGSKLYQCWKGR
jgi:hypothetical protein